MTDTQNLETNSSKAPDFIVHTIREERGKKYWTRIGAAWAHKDKNGFNIELEALPINRRLVLLVPKEKDSNQ